MERWALVSGLKGDADLYEQLQRDLKRQRGVAYLFVLGDLIGPDQDCNYLINASYLSTTTSNCTSKNS